VLWLVSRCHARLRRRYPLAIPKDREAEQLCPAGPARC
jgi:hypothetical protein